MRQISTLTPCLVIKTLSISDLQVSKFVFRLILERAFLSLRFGLLSFYFLFISSVLILLCLNQMKQNLCFILLSFLLPKSCSKLMTFKEIIEQDNGALKVEIIVEIYGKADWLTSIINKCFPSL